MTQNRRRPGLTLVELTIAVFIATLLLTTAFKLLSNWMRSSVRGASHLSNMQVAVLLSNQIEHDLQRAIKLELGQNSFQITTVTNVGGGKAEENVTYEEMPGGEGFRRATFAGPKILHDRNLAAGFRVNRVNSEPILQKIVFAEDRFCVKIQLQVASAKNEEPYNLEKLVFCSDAPENRLIKSWID